MIKMYLILTLLCTAVLQAEVFRLKNNYVKYKVMFLNEDGNFVTNFVTYTVTDYNDVTTSYRLKVEHEGSQIYSDWIAGYELDGENASEDIFKKCVSLMGDIDSVDIPNYATVPACLLKKDLFTPNYGEIKLPDNFNLDLIIGNEPMNRFWFNSQIPIFGVAKMVGKNAGALVVEFGQKLNDEPLIFKRPSGPNAIKVNPLTCVCVNRTAISLGDCDSFCADKTDTSETLYASITPGIDVVLNDIFGLNGEGDGNLFGWCTAVLPNGISSNPGCVLEFDNQKGSVTQVPVNVWAGSNNFSASVQELALETNYVVKLKEVESGAVSSAFEVYIKDPSSADPIPGPLPTIALHQYFCVARSGAVINGQLNVTNALKVHFYFHDRLEPTPLKPEEEFLLCHDINLNPGSDSAAYPRIGKREQEFRVWSRYDLRFEDTGQAYAAVDAANGNLDINDEIHRRLTQIGDTSSIGMVGVYNYFNWPTDPDNRENPYIQGVIMIPWINQKTNRGFCPVQQDYSSGDKVFQILKDLGANTDTEAIYMAVREKEPFYDLDGNFIEAPDDVILIRESELNKIWFYFENGTPMVANNIAATQKTIRFYWPPRGTDPLTKQGDQKLYTIKAPDEIGSNGFDISVQNLVRPSDKRFGCVPVLGNSVLVNVTAQLGQSCRSDFECESLCCSEQTGQCLDDISCNKEQGQSCVAKNYCGKQTVVDEILILTGPNPTTCSLYSIKSKRRPDCINSFCDRVVPKSVPDYSPLNTDCSAALPMSNFDLPPVTPTPGPAPSPTPDPIPSPTASPN
jgi:hypothetical protein